MNVCFGASELTSLSQPRIHLCSEKAALSYFWGARGGQATVPPVLVQMLIIFYMFLLYFALVGTDPRWN